MNEVRVITDDTADVRQFTPPAEWGEDSDGAMVAGVIRYVELIHNGMAQLGLTILADGSIELETFGHGYSLKLAGQVVLTKP